MIDSSQIATGHVPGVAQSRWFMLAMGTMLLSCLGTVYAWSYFQKPLMTYAGWSNQQVTWVFSLTIFIVGIFATVGGNLLEKHGPRKLAVTGSLLYALGWILGGLALSIKNLPLMYLGMGVIGGCGLGMGYVTPVATVSKWFPDRKGLSTAIVLTGFGLGALLNSTFVAPQFVNAFTTGSLTAWPKVFICNAFALGVPALFASVQLKSPPAEYCPPGWTPPLNEAAANGKVDTSVRACVTSRPFAIIWFMLFVNVTAGMLIIAFQSPLLQDLLKAKDSSKTTASLAGAGAALIGLSALCNGGGRPLWGHISDRIGRIQTWRIILSTQVMVFIALIFVRDPFLFSILVCYTLLCTGAGFATAPSLVATVFGNRAMAPVYGAVLTAWSLGGIVGPQMLAMGKDLSNNDPYHAASLTFSIIAGLLGLAFLTSLMLTNKPYEHRCKSMSQ